MQAKHLLRNLGLASAMALTATGAVWANVITAQTHQGNLYVPFYDDISSLDSPRFSQAAGGRIIVQYTGRCLVNSRNRGAKIRMSVHLNSFDDTGLAYRVAISPSYDLCSSRGAALTHSGSGGQMKMVKAVFQNLPAGNYFVSLYPERSGLDTDAEEKAILSNSTLVVSR